METLACLVYPPKEFRLETVPVPDVMPHQVLLRVGAGGICGSDLHYYRHGGFGVVRVSEPFVLGHEAAGTVEAVGALVTRVKVGDRVAINPSRPCGRCKFCLAGEQQHCLDMWFNGSAMRTPHSQGLFRRHVVVDADLCEPVGERVSLGEAACTEPLAVALHAVAQAGPLLGKRVLVTGSGPIGALVMAAARLAGALEIVATDLHDGILKKAVDMGATRAVNVSVEPGLKATEFTADKGYFDVAFECTGAPPVLLDVLPALRPRGTLIQLGLAGDATLPVSAIVAKEIRFAGSFRFHQEYALAARLIGDGRIDVKPIITATFPVERAAEAFELAGDRRTQMKVQITFD